MGSDISQFSASPETKQHTWTLAAYRYMARKRLGKNTALDLKSIATKSWDIAPGETTVSPPAIFLPGQMERVTGWEGKRFTPTCTPLAPWRAASARYKGQPAAT